MVLSNYLKILKVMHDREWEFLLYTRRKLLYFSILFPIFVYILLLCVFTNPVVRNIPIGVIDRDNSEISRNLVSRINISPNVSITQNLGDTDEAKRLISNSTIYGVVIIPEDFSKRVLARQSADVIFYYNNELFLQGGTVYKGVFSAVQDFSDKYNIKYMMSKGVPAYSAEHQANPVIMGEHTLFNPYLNYRYFFLLGMFPAAFQLLIICVLVYVFTYEEKTKAFLDIANMASNAPLSVVIGKCLPYISIFMTGAGIMLFVMFSYIGIPIRGGLFTIILATLLFVTASITAGVLIAVIFRHIAFSAAAVYAAPAFAYAGITYPQLAMPDLAFVWSELLPLTHYHRILVNEAVRGGLTGSSSYFEILYMIIFSFIVYVIAIFRFKKAGEKYSDEVAL